MKHKKAQLADLPGHVKCPDFSVYLNSNYVVLDFETTTILKGSPLAEDNRIVMASWKTADGEVRSHFGSEFDQADMVAAVREADYVVAHNAKFELGWLARCGIDLRSIVVYDTFVGEYVIGGNRYTYAHLSLNACLERYGLNPKEDTIGKMFKAGIDTADMPESWLQHYCERDVTATEELFLLQRAKLSKNNQLHLQYQRCLLSPALADIEANGMVLDETKVDQAMAELEDNYARLTSKLQDFMGGIPPSATKQKGEYLFNVLKFAVPRDHRGNEMRTSKGLPSCAQPVIERLRAKTQKQHDWLLMNKEWSRIHSDLTKYLRKFKDCCREAGGHIRATFNQCATRTHRLSSSGLVHKVQFQNLNRKFKPIFKARHEGWSIGEADGAQLEYRIAMHMARDPMGYKDIVTGKDIHRFSASELNDIPESEVTPAQRQTAKADTFKPTYGGKSGTVAQQRYYRAFAERYNVLDKTQRGWTHTVVNKKKLTTEYGLTFYWPHAKMTQSGWITHTTNIYNYPIQGFATAEIIPLAIVCAWHRMKNMESFLVNTVHDSIIGEIHPDETDLWHEVAQQCLIKDCYYLLEALYDVRLTVPLGAGVMLGTHWSDEQAKASETVYTADPMYYEAAAAEAGMI
jgi:DNA polymerase I